MHIVIPAAGASKRFVEQGYPVKALVDVLGKSMMQRVIENVRPSCDHHVTVVSQVSLPGVDADVMQCGPTRGSVESILNAGIRDGEPLLLVNQDQLVDLDVDRSQGGDLRSPSRGHDHGTMGHDSTLLP